MSREERLTAIYDTLECLERGYLTRHNEKIMLDPRDMTTSVEGTVKLTKAKISAKVKEVRPGEKEGAVVVVNGDTFEVALLLKKAGYNPVVLNMASGTRPGGGYMNGAGAQEESLFRRSNLAYCLDNDYVNQNFYPLGPSEVIYTPQVIVFKDTEAKKYAPLSPRNVGVITCPAYKCREGEKWRRPLKELTKTKMDLILQTGIVYGHDAIVLGALGCGAYRNPPAEIASLFHETITGYRKYYRYIVFAIIDDRNGFTNDRRGNVAIFSAGLGTEAVSPAHLDTMLTSTLKD